MSYPARAEGLVNMNTSIPQTFVNKVIGNILRKDHKHEIVNSKCQVFIWPIDKKKEVVVSLLVEQDATRFAVHEWSASGVDPVTNQDVSECWGAAWVGL